MVELQDQLKQAQGPEPAKEVLMKVGRRVGYPSLCFLSARASSSFVTVCGVTDDEYPLVCFQTGPESWVPLS